jgi:competence protein ComEC
MDKKIIAFLGVMLVFVLISGCTDKGSSNSSAPTSSAIISTSSGNLVVHYIDIGQGDAELIQYNGKNMLIDAGEIGKGDDVEKELKKDGVTKLDYVVATHPHADHIGGMSVILKDFQVLHFISNGDTQTTTKVYEDMLQTLDSKNVSFRIAHEGDYIDFDPGINITILNPPVRKFTTDAINQNSVVLKVVDNQITFLFMGDAGDEAEAGILKEGYNVKADILKVGHHGSRTASSDEFITAVKPSLSIVSDGVGNTYGLPDEDVIAKLTGVSRVLQTEESGTITVTTDGSKYSVNTEK